MTKNEWYINVAKEITIAKLSSSTLSACLQNGNDTAAFFEAIYKKVKELAEHDKT